MPTPQRRRSVDLIEQLFEAPHRFEFFQAVRLLERWLASDEPRASGELLPPELRFLNSTSLSFPASEIESLQVLRREKTPDDGEDERALVERIEITPAFMGMLGLAGTLPLIYTEQIAQRELHQKDASARSFLDMFSHRAVSLFYAGWKKSRLHLQYEADRKNRFAPMVLALAGVGQTSLNDRLKPEEGGVNDESLAFFAGALQQRALSAQQLQQLLSRYLRVPVRIEQFCGRWYTLPPSARTALGVGSNGVLGRNALSGERVWQRDLRVKVILGPLTHVLFQRFLPGAPGATALRELLTLLSGVSLEYEINLTLRADAVQSSALDSKRSSFAGRLGWDTYVQTRPQHADRCDVRYDVHAAMAA
ncbi:MAG: type VI secretion system baseplate subunit TssG [Cytophagales bacterium]|nr:type VI secretion system baseplate subunit TssG [Rhizobacter sp.]